jgi:hypothetical protein
MVYEGTREKKVVYIGKELSEIRGKYGDMGKYTVLRWSLEHFHYNYNEMGRCKNISVCLEDIEKKGYTEGVCDDISRLAAYLYIKARYGDPLFIHVRVNDTTSHSELAIFDGEYIDIFYGMEYIEVEDIHFASEILGITANRTRYDVWLYNVMSKTKVVRSGSIEDYADAVNHGGIMKVGYTTVRVSPLVLERGRENLVHVTGLTSVKSSCPFRLSNYCPVSGGDVFISPDSDVCELSGEVLGGGNANFYLIVKP